MHYYGGMRANESKKQRITNLRKAIIDIFSQEHGPWTVGDIIEKLHKKGFSPNKTTVYRGVEYLLGIETKRPIDFGEGKKRYEIFRESDHHHHLFCTNCSAVEEIVINDDFENQKKEISNNTNFKIKSHSLEFFGVCSECQKKEKKCR